MASDLSGDGLVDVVRVGRGNTTGAPDVLWVASGVRQFVRRDLTSGNRLSLAVELVDIDGDDLTDIWITRDLGWSHGGDALLSRLGDPDGEWVDISEEMGSALQVDSMGVTVADLNGDLVLDAYVSDLGDNEVLVGGSDGFEPLDESGAARIRPPGAPDSLISSSWASGSADLNLDGLLDLVVVNGGFPGGGVQNKIAGTTVSVTDSPSVLIGIGGGRFVDVWAELGLESSEPARGLSVADIDGDGDDDILIVLVTGGIRVFDNSASAASLTISAASGCDPVGAVVTVVGEQTRFQALLAPHTYAGAHGFELIVGIADTDLEVTVDWADGSSSSELLADLEGRSRLAVQC